MWAPCGDGVVRIVSRRVLTSPFTRRVLLMSLVVRNQPSGPSEFELGRGHLGSAVCLKNLEGPLDHGGERTSLLRLPAPEAPTRGLHRRSGGDDDAGAPAASRPPLGGRICSWCEVQRRVPRSPPRRRRASHAPAGFAAGRSGCASDLGPLLGGQPDARDAGPAVSRCVCGL